MKDVSRHWGLTPGERRAVLLLCVAFLAASAYHIYERLLIPQSIKISSADSLAVEAIREASSGSILSPSGDNRQGMEGNGSPVGLLNLNTATRTQLEALPGIGPVLAGRILEAREKAGFFTKLEDLLSVPGIGPKRLDTIRPLVTCTEPEDIDN